MLPLMITFFSCLFIGLEWGFLVGVVSNLAMLLVVASSPHVPVLKFRVSNPYSFSDARLPVDARVAERISCTHGSGVPRVRVPLTPGLLYITGKVIFIFLSFIIGIRRYESGYSSSRPISLVSRY